MFCVMRSMASNAPFDDSHWSRRRFHGSLDRERREAMGLHVTPVSGALGAEIHGLDPRRVDDATFAGVRSVLHNYEVIFFRDVALGPDEHLAFARRFGSLSVFPFARLLGATEPTFQVITDGPDSRPEADDWHTDVTWTDCPPKYALLHAEVVPERGGDTLWASMTTAHDALSPAMRRMIAGLNVVHDNESFIAGMQRKLGVNDESNDLACRLRETYPPVLHPLVRVHPETGRRVLYLGGRFMRRIDGMTEAESRAVLDLLSRHVEDVRFHCRWRWHPGDLAIWDERSTNHRSAADHYPQHRSFRRIEVAGDRPYFDPATEPFD
jgi:taurine dioxygenase